MSGNTPEPAQLGPEDILDERLYNLTDEEHTFFKQQTGIQDDEELKTHILQVQTEAYKVHPYLCIHGFYFTKLKISRLFPYQDLLKLGKQCDGSVLLDIGSCCELPVGNDACKAVADGYPLEHVVTSDLRREFADLGHKLFRTTPETYLIAFIPGNAFNPKHLKVVPPFVAANAPMGPVPDLRSLTSLNPLHGRVSTIHASFLFHLFSEEEQLYLARALVGLLSPEPGSMIFGLHLGLAEKGWMPAVIGRGHYLFYHSPESWAQLWDGLVFEKGVVKVQKVLVQMDRKSFDSDEAVLTLLLWSVTHL